MMNNKTGTTTNDKIIFVKGSCSQLFFITLNKKKSMLQKTI